MTDEEVAGWIELLYRSAVIALLIFIAVKVAEIASH